MRNSMVCKMRVDSGIAFASIILNAVTLGAAGPVLQGIANLTMGQIIDFSDLAHVHKVLKSEKIETVKTVESIAISDVVDCGMDVIELELVVAERRPNMQLEEAIKTQNSAFIIAEAATILSQG
jgi:hypothetical protein